MGHVVKNTNWCVIDIDTRTGQIFFQQRWRYHWNVIAGLTAWTLAEKRDFHNRADRSIWAAWSNRARFNVTGTSAFARRHRAAGVPINLDVRWVTASEHWNVNVWKIAPGSFRTSNIIWNTRTINLDTNDFVTRNLCNSALPRVCTNQVPVAHEFGHAAGNTGVLGRGDEYPAGSPHQGDQSSILNSGSQLRNRHFRTILDQMNTMIPGTTFSVRSV